MCGCRELTHGEKTLGKKRGKHGGGKTTRDEMGVGTSVWMWGQQFTEMYTE
jgi:hypothetical protein